MASFPNSVWNGTTAGRPDLNTVTPPDHRDWVALVREVQAVQKYVLSLTSNIEVMPDLAEDLQRSSQQLDKLAKGLEKLQLPDDLHSEMTQLREAVTELDFREDHDRLRRGLNKLFLRTRTLEKAYKDLREELHHELKVFMNELRNQVSAGVRETNEKYRVLREQIKELQDVLQEPDLR